MRKIRFNQLKRAFRVRPVDLLTSLLIIAAASLLSVIVIRFSGSDSFVPMLFVTAIFMVARFTDGYTPGILSSVICVFLVNYAFTYPYMAFNFRLADYPVTFVILLLTSAMTSALTTRIKLHEEIRYEAEREKMRGNLLRSVSHDLRTPLTSISGITGILLEDDGKIPPEKQKELLRDVHAESDELIRMVENLLSITRVNGEPRLVMSDEPAEEIIEAAVSRFRKHAPGAVVTVSVPDEFLLVPMDAMLIEQVLMNLLENALLHGGKRDGISVSLSRKNADAVFSVEDHGKGISPSILPHLFDGTIIEDADRSETRHGMGIGLAVCKSIIEAHGGVLTGFNTPSGACFRFTLPIKEVTP